MYVRRSSDDLEAVIGFDADGNLDETALLAHTGANDGFVRVWYDQSGSGNDMSQAAHSLQPRIVNAGVMETLTGGQAALNNNAAPQHLAATLDVATCFAVMETSDTTSVIFVKTASVYVGAYQAGSSSATASGYVVQESYVDDVSVANHRGDLSTAVSDGSVHIYGLRITASTTQAWRPFGYASGGFEYDGKYSEIIIYPDDQSANMSGITGMINDKYSAY